MTKSDPFTRTPGVAGKAYIDCGVADEIINNFSDNDSAKYVYKLTGLRGSGKSVEYSKVIQTLKEKKDWLVYPLSSSGNVLKTLLARISAEKFIQSDKKTKSVTSKTSVSGNVILASGNEEIDITRTISDNDNYYSDEAIIVKMITKANKKGYKVLIAIDDIAKTSDTVYLLSIVGSMLLEGLSVYLLVTGLYENIEEFSSEKNLTFFKRADTREMGALSKYDIEYMYEKLLEIDSSKARELTELSKGYAYAYQVLGSLYFCKKDNETIDDILPDFSRILFRDSYDLIWKSLSNGEKSMVRCICKSKNKTADEIKSLMKNPSTYPVYRERLMSKHVVDGSIRGILQINLPQFDAFVNLWGDE